MSSRCLWPLASSPPGRRDRGMALVTVLWLVALLSVIAVNHSGNARSELSLTGHQQAMAQARALAEAGARRAMLDLTRPPAERHWPADGSTRPFEFAGRTVNVAVQDSKGLVDLNLASAALLNTALSAAEPDQQRRLRIVDAILDWRDEDDFHRVNGAEREDYLAAGYAWTARNARFQTIDELLYVMDMSPRVYTQIAPFLTLYSESTGVDLQFAPAPLFDLLTAADQGRTAPQAKPAPSFSSAFHIIAEVPLSPVSSFQTTVVVQLTSDPDAPFIIRRWLEASTYQRRSFDEQPLT